jgi:hypothetical protein
MAHVVRQPPCRARWIQQGLSGISKLSTDQIALRKAAGRWQQRKSVVDKSAKGESMMNYLLIVVGGYLVFSLFAVVVLYCACVLASRSRSNARKLYGTPFTDWSRPRAKHFPLRRSGVQPEAVMRLWG